MIPLDDPADPAEAPDPAWYDNLELWRRGLDRATRPDLRRVVVSHLDPPLARRITGEVPAIDVVSFVPGAETPAVPSGRSDHEGPPESSSPPVDRQTRFGRGRNGRNGHGGTNGSGTGGGSGGAGVLPATPMLSMTKGATSPPTWSTSGETDALADAAGASESASAPTAAGDVDGLWPTGLVRQPHRRSAAERTSYRTRVRLVRLGWAVGLVLAVAFAWFVLVAMRAPGSDDAPVDEIGIGIHRTMTDTLIADRMVSLTGWIVTVSTTLVLGGVIFRVFVMRARTNTNSAPAPGNLGLRVLRTTAIVGILAEVASLSLRAAAMSDTGFAAAWDPDILRFVLTGRFGDAALVRIAGLALLAGFLPVLPIGPASRRPAMRGRAGERIERLACLAGGAVILLSFSVVGHPQASAPAVLLVPVQWVHVTAVSTWFGGVTFLCLELREQRRDGSARGFAEIVRRFSAVATVTIFLAGVTGLVMAYSQLDTVGALRGTPYGRALMVKVAVLSVPLAIGGYNRQRIVPAIVDRDEPSAWRHLRFTLVLETLLIAMGVLLATAAMTSGGFQ